MRFGRTLVSFIGFTVMLLCAELWLVRGLAAQKSRIAFSNLVFDNYEIYVMDADGGNRENLSNHPVDDTDPDWSPNGTKIAFVTNRDDGVFQVYVMDADGSNQIRLTYGPRDKRHPDWSPDGRKIAFTVLPNLDDDVWIRQIDIIDAGGQNREKFEDHAMQPSWSPDGQKIAFASTRDRSAKIYVIGADGQGLVRVTHGLLGGQSPAFSPDGRRIAYYSWDEKFHHIHLVEADGNNGVRLTHNQEHYVDPAWSSDGGTIAYAVANDKLPFKSRIHLMTSDGKRLKRLTNIRDGVDEYPDFNPVGLAVSPASKTATIWGKLKIPFEK